MNTNLNFSDTQLITTLLAFGFVLLLAYIIEIINFITETISKWETMRGWEKQGIVTQLIAWGLFILTLCIVIVRLLLQE